MTRYLRCGLILFFFSQLSATLAAAAHDRDIELSRAGIFIPAPQGNWVEVNPAQSLGQHAVEWMEIDRSKDGRLRTILSEFGDTQNLQASAACEKELQSLKTAGREASLLTPPEGWACLIEARYGTEPSVLTAIRTVPRYSHGTVNLSARVFASVRDVSKADFVAWIQTFRTKNGRNLAGGAK